MVLVDGIPLLSSCTVYIDTLYHFSRWHFNPWTIFYIPDLMLPSESSFSQSMHCALMASVWPNKIAPLLNTLSTDADLVLRKDFRMANCFVVSHKTPRCAIVTAVKNYRQKSWKTARLFLQHRDQDQDQNVEDQDQDLMIQDKDQDFHFCPRGLHRW